VPAGAAVATATAGGGQWQVSTAGGVFPVWRRDGKELYYVTDAGEMMAAPIAIRGATIDPGVPVKLFTPRIVGEGNIGIGRQYDVDPAGRFLINTELNEAPAPITLVVNWKPGGAK
jgi:eukaryotic-like serine/threonine-protein kinase